MLGWGVGGEWMGWWYGMRLRMPGGASGGGGVCMGRGMEIWWDGEGLEGVFMDPSLLRSFAPSLPRSFTPSLIRSFAPSFLHSPSGERARGLGRYFNLLCSQYREEKLMGNVSSRRPCPGLFGLLIVILGVILVICGLFAGYLGVYIY